MSAREGLPSGWTWVTLGQLGTWVGGGTPSKARAAYWTGGAIPWVSPKDMKRSVIDDAEDHITELAVTESSTQLVPTGSVLIVTRSGILQHTVPVAVTACPVTLNQDIKALIGNGVALPEYVAAFVRASQDALLAACSKAGTTVASINLDALKAYPLPLPPVAEQRRIVAKLDELLASSRAARAALGVIPGRLKHLRQAILSSTLEKAADSCTSKTLGELASVVTSGSRGWAKYYAASGPIFIRSQDINEDRLRLDGVAHVSPPSEAAEGRRTRVKRDDLLITITGANVTRVAHVQHELAEAYVSQHVALVRLHDPLLAPYVHCWLLSEQHGRGQLRQAAYGNGKPGLSLHNVRDVRLKLPPATSMGEVIERVERGWQAAHHIEHLADESSDRTRQLETRVLASAFRGELLAQKPSDEPAAALLERLRSGCTVVAAVRGTRRGRTQA